MNPKPYWILRHHGSSSIRALHHAHNLLAVGDECGCVSLVDLAVLRRRFTWTPHTDSILTVVVVDAQHVVTHARDNTLKLWRLPSTLTALGSGDGMMSNDVGHSTSSAPLPELVRDIGVNALNFAKCSMLDNSLAVPNALDAAYIDIIDLTTGVRTHEAIGRPDIQHASGKRLPIVMSLHLLSSQELVAGYEDGCVKKWSLHDSQLVWQARCHSESVMALAVSETRFGISVGADDRLARFDLSTGETTLTQTDTAGKSSTAIAPDALTFAVGAWDGSITVYSTADLSRLGSLDYHKDTVECLAFARVKIPNKDDDSDSDSDSDSDFDSDSDDNDGDGDGHDKVPSQGVSHSAHQLILAAGGRDGKVSLWTYH